MRDPNSVVNDLLKSEKAPGIFKDVKKVCFTGSWFSHKLPRPKSTLSQVAQARSIHLHGRMPDHQLCYRPHSSLLNFIGFSRSLGTLQSQPLVKFSPRIDLHVLDIKKKYIETECALELGMGTGRIRLH